MKKHNPTHHSGASRYSRKSVFGFTLVELLACQPKPWRRQARQAFTLVELLVVIAIMALIIGMSIPALKGMSEGSALRSATAQIRTTLSLARQYAITHNTTVRFLIADEAQSPYPAGHEEKCYRAYAVYDYGRNVNSSTDDKYVKEWVTLPAGIVFDRDITSFEYDDQKFNNLSRVNTYSANSPETLFPGTKGSPKTKAFRAFTFTADGKARLNTPSNHGTIILAEGSVLFSNSAFDYQVERDGRRPLSGTALVVYPFGGRIKTVDMSDTEEVGSVN